MLTLGLIDSEALLKTVAASAVAGLAITLIFSLAIYGATRFVELSGDERFAAAGAAAALAVVSLVAFVAAVTVGIVVMVDK
jgi:hypothetical protein